VTPGVRGRSLHAFCAFSRFFLHRRMRQPVNTGGWRSGNTPKHSRFVPFVNSVVQLSGLNLEIAQRRFSAYSYTIMKRELILASASPRRSAILRELGLDFKVVVAAVDEVHYDEDPRATVLENARRKCMAVAAQYPQNAVLAADTVVVFDGRTVGKPADMAAARSMLAMFSGRSQQVFTGVALALPQKAEPKVWLDVSTVNFKDISGDDIDRYFDRIDPLDRAGAYDIDCCGDMVISGYDGSYSNVMGLSAKSVLRELEAIGWKSEG